MYTEIGTKKPSKKLGSFFITASEYDLFALYLFLGRAKDDSFVCYRVDATKGKKYGKSYLIDFARLQNIYDYFIQNMMNEPIDMCDIQVLKRLDFQNNFKVDLPLVNKDVLQSWYVKSKLVNKDLIDIIFSSK